METELYISYNSSGHLPIIPRHITKLTCTHSHLQTLTQYPTLWQLLTGKGIPSIKIPDNIIALDISSNSIRKIHTRQLPQYLQILLINTNLLTNLPILPDTLNFLICKWNRLSTLSERLPTALVVLNCEYNDLTYLPPLPKTLQRLDCSNNRLKTLPDNLCETALTYLDCSYNDLTIIPELPKNLNTLYLYRNPLLYLPYLPTTLNRIGYVDVSFTVLEVLYPKISNAWSDTSDAISYINSRNRGLIKIRMDAINHNNILWLLYMKRAMHPDRFAKALLDDPDLDIEEYTQKYIEAL